MTFYKLHYNLFLSINPQVILEKSEIKHYRHKHIFFMLIT